MVLSDFGRQQLLRVLSNSRLALRSFQPFFFCKMIGQTCFDLDLDILLGLLFYKDHHMYVILSMLVVSFLRAYEDVTNVTHNHMSLDNDVTSK